MAHSKSEVLVPEIVCPATADDHRCVHTEGLGGPRGHRMLLDDRLVHSCRDAGCESSWVDENEPLVDLTPQQAATVYHNARLFQNSWWARG